MNKMEELNDKAYQMGIQAAVSGWMEFSVKDFDDDELNGDIEELMQIDQEGWEQTDHYQVLYRKFQAK